MFDVHAAASLVYPILGIGGVAFAFTRWGTKNVTKAVDSRAKAVADPIAAQLVELKTTMEEGFRLSTEAQTTTNDHLKKLNSKVATQEARTSMLNQRQAYLEGRLGLPLGPMPDRTQDHLAGLAYIEGKKDMEPGALREA